MYTKDEILNIAKKQLALNYNCEISDLDKEGNIISENKPLEGRFICDSDGCFMKIACIAGKAMICADKEIIPWCRESFLEYNSSWLFDYDSLRNIDNKLQEFGHKIECMKNYYLTSPISCSIDPITSIEWLEKEDILQYKGDNRFEEAFIFDENTPDYLGVAAYDGEDIMGIAGSSEDGKMLYQIGIDVLTKYRGKGIGTNLVSLLRQELLNRGKIPFYGTAASHIVSRNIAINAGFFPAWTEIYSKKLDD